MAKANPFARTGKGKKVQIRKGNAGNTSGS